jgi:hypothetical protein
MFEKSEIEVLKKKLPRNYLKPIADKTGLSFATIARFFNFQKIRQMNAEDIYDTCLEIIEKHKDKKESRDRKIKKLLIDEEQQSLNL